MDADRSVQGELDALMATGRSRVEATMAIIGRIEREARRARTVVLVEGLSDQIAVETVAERQGRDLHAGATFVVPTGGFTNFGRFLRVFGPRGADIRVLGLCDSPVEDRIRRSLVRAGIMQGDESLSAVGFHACVSDLEEELIGALGPRRVEGLIAEEDELASLQRLQRMPYHRERALADQLHRFIGSRAGRKYRYARAMALAVDLADLPAPLSRLFDQL